MPDREKVIKALEERISTCSIIGDGFDVTINWRLADDILSLLKEQEAVEPVMKKGRLFTASTCRKCGYFFPTGTKPNYCQECGQEVKWK